MIKGCMQNFEKIDSLLSVNKINKREIKKEIMKR